MTERHDLSTEEARHRADDQPVAGGHWPEHAGEHTTDDHTDAAYEGDTAEAGTGSQWGEPTTDEHATDEHATDEHATDEHASTRDEHVMGEHSTGYPATDEHVMGEHTADEHAMGDTTGEHAVGDTAGEHSLGDTADEHALGEHSTDATREEEPVGASPWNAEAADQHVAGTRTDDEPGEAALAHEDAVATESAAEPDAAVAAGPDAVLASDAAQPDTAAETETAAARPTNADDFTVERLIDSADADRFHDSWRDVKAGFVDDPADALRRASALSDDVVAELTAGLGRFRQTIDEHWQGGEKHDTERLRVALRGYGSLLDHILNR